MADRAERAIETDNVEEFKAVTGFLSCGMKTWKRSCFHHSPAILRFLLQTERFNVNRASEASGPASLATPLHYAANCHFVEGCTMLLSAGACTKNLTTDGLSPLMFSLIPSKFGEQSKDVKERRLATVTLLVNHDPSTIELASYDGVLPVHLASLRDDPDLIDAVVCPGTLNRHSKIGESPLRTAAATNKLRSVAHLLKLGATEGLIFTNRTFQQGALGGGALASASAKGFEGAVRMLTTREYLVGIGGREAVKYAALGAIINGHARVLQILVDADILWGHDLCGGGEHSLLRVAVSRGKLPCLSTLLSKHPISSLAPTTTARLGA